ADELDQLRLSLGQRAKSGGRISLPANIHLDVPQLLLADFEQAFYARTVEQTTLVPWLPLNIQRTEEFCRRYQSLDKLPSQSSKNFQEREDAAWLSQKRQAKFGRSRQAYFPQ